MKQALIDIYCEQHSEKSEIIMDCKNKTVSYRGKTYTGSEYHMFEMQLNRALIRLVKGKYRDYNANNVMAKKMGRDDFKT